MFALTPKPQLDFFLAIGSVQADQMRSRASQCRHFSMYNFTVKVRVTFSVLCSTRVSIAHVNNIKIIITNTILFMLNYISILYSKIVTN